MLSDHKPDPYRRVRRKPIQHGGGVAVAVGVDPDDLLDPAF
jgi:hypothetical protein